MQTFHNLCLFKAFKAFFLLWKTSARKRAGSARTAALRTNFHAVHNTPKEFENGGFTLKTHQMFSVLSTPGKFKNPTIAGHLDLCLRKTRSGKSYLSWRIVFRNLRPQNVFRSHENEKPAFSIPPVWRVFSKSRNSIVGHCYWPCAQILTLFGSRNMLHNKMLLWKVKSSSAQC